MGSTPQVIANPFEDTQSAQGDQQVIANPFEGDSTQASPTPPPQKGGWAGFKRAAGAILHSPVDAYNAFTTPAQNEEEQAAQYMPVMAGPGQVYHLPTQIQLGIHRLLTLPLVHEQQKADAYQTKATGSTDVPPVQLGFDTGAGDTYQDRMQHSANNHRLASHVPLVGPIASGIVDRYYGIGDNEGQGPDKMGALAELGTTIAAPKALEKGLGTVASGLKAGATVAGDTAGKVKNALSIPDQLKADAGAYAGDAGDQLRQQSAQQPAQADVDLARKKVTDMRASAVGDQEARIGKVLDSSANEAGLDTSSIDSLPHKASAGGAAFKAKAQSIYKQLDQIAADATGQEGAFQRLGKAVTDAKEELANPQLTEAERPAATERLNNAQAQLDAHVQAAAAKGIDASQAARQADAFYSRGMALEETGRALGTNVETGGGNMLSNNRPYGAAVKKLSEPGVSTRTHVLENAVGEQGANEIRQATMDSANNIKQQLADQQAARVRNQNVKNSVTDANRQLRDLQTKSNAAQQRIDQVKANRRAVTKGAIGALAGAGAAGYFSTGAKVKDALSNR